VQPPMTMAPQQGTALPAQQMEPHRVRLLETRGAYDILSFSVTARIPLGCALQSYPAAAALGNKVADFCTALDIPVHSMSTVSRVWDVKEKFPAAAWGVQIGDIFCLHPPVGRPWWNPDRDLMAGLRVRPLTVYVIRQKAAMLTTAVMQALLMEAAMPVRIQDFSTVAPSGTSLVCRIILQSTVSVCAGFLILPDCRCTFVHARQAIQTQHVLSPNTTFWFSIPGRGPISLNVEYTLGPMLAFLKQTAGSREAAFGEGTWAQPLTVYVARAAP
jgi:hypothetical protein